MFASWRLILFLTTSLESIRSPLPIVLKSVSQARSARSFGALVSVPIESLAGLT